jgi:hypothetical protein
MFYRKAKWIAATDRTGNRGEKTLGSFQKNQNV